MIEGLKPYPSMRDSGVRWLGQVPTGWSVRRLRNVAEMRVSNVDKHANDGEEPVRLCNYVDVYKNDRIHPSMSFMRATATRDEVARFCLARGDVLITKDSETWNDIGVPALVVESADDLVSGYHLALLRPFAGRIVGPYLFRALQSVCVAYQFHVEANGVTRYGLSHAAIKSAWLPVPPLPEQTAIVRFLDHADLRIRRYIRAKQNLIRLLEEQKHTIIFGAITRGLDMNVSLKQFSGGAISSVVPNHWHVGRLSQFFTLQRGFDITKDKQRPGTVPVVSSGGVSSYHDASTAKGPGVLVGRKGTAGAVHYMPADYWAHDTTLWVNDFKGNCPRFIYYVLSAMDLQRFDTGSANPTINRNVLHPQRVAFPSPVEQSSIASILDKQLTSLAHATAKARREIDLLGEYRATLLAAVVAGKLDVREAAARLPEDVEEPDGGDEVDAEADIEESSDEVDAVAAEAEA